MQGGRGWHPNGLESAWMLLIQGMFRTLVGAGHGPHCVTFLSRRLLNKIKIHTDGTIGLPRLLEEASGSDHLRPGQVLFMPSWHL